MRTLFLVAAAMAMASPAMAAKTFIHHGNRVTADHMSRMKQTKDRAHKVIDKNPRLRVVIRERADAFARIDRPLIIARQDAFEGAYARLGEAYRPWTNLGFKSAFSYPVVIDTDVQAELDTPLVFWLYSDAADADYYRAWYGADYDATAALQIPLSTPGIFFPTVALTDLALGVSSMPAALQGNFRIGLNDLIVRLQAKLAMMDEPMPASDTSGASGMSGAPAGASGTSGTTSLPSAPPTLGRNDIVITHYQMLDAAVVLDGFVGVLDHEFAFKALLSLNDPSSNALFVPSGPVVENQPNPQANELRDLNLRIIQLGGATDSDARDGSMPAELLSEHGHWDHRYHHWWGHCWGGCWGRRGD